MMNRKWTETTASGHHMLFSGRTYNRLSRGVAIVTTKEVYRSLIERKPIDERFIKARYNSAFAKLTIITCYSPTEDAETEESEGFYDSRQKVVHETPLHDVLLINGDLNAKVGIDTTGKENVMGRLGIGNSNTNGERPSAFCHKTTW